jgi:hypothetical protein
MHIPSSHPVWFDRFNNFYDTHFLALNSMMVWIHDTTTLLRHVNKATQANCFAKLCSCHNNRICEQYTGDRNHYSNLPMTSNYSMLTRNPHHSTVILLTSLPSVTCLPSRPIPRKSRCYWYVMQLSCYLLYNMCIVYILHKLFNLMSGKL